MGRDKDSFSEIIDVSTKRELENKQKIENALSMIEVSDAKAKAFAKHYFQTKDLLQSYALVKDGLSDRAAKLLALRLLDKPIVKKEIDRLSKEYIKNLEYSEDGVKDFLKCVADFDVADLFDVDGRIRSIDQIPAAARKAIASIEWDAEKPCISNDFTTKMYIKSIKFYDKLKASELMGKNFKMFVDKVEHDVKLDLASELLEARKRVGREIINTTCVEIPRGQVSFEDEECLK